MKKTLLFTLAILILASCTTSNEVVSNKIFQKRKYKKGWHVNLPSKIKKVEKDKTIDFDTELVAQDKSENNKPIQKANKSSVIITQLSKINNGDIDLSSEIISKNDYKESVATKNTFEIKRSELQKREKQPINKDNIESVNVKHSTGYSMTLLIILCVILPPLAVAMARHISEKEFLYSIFFTLLLWVPGIVYAFLIIYNRI